MIIKQKQATYAHHAITHKLRHPGLGFGWLSLTLFAHRPIRMLGLLLLFTLNYLFSAQCYLKTAFLLASQNAVIFSCISLDIHKHTYMYINDLPNCLEYSKPRMYADDTHLTLSISNINNIGFYLKQDL